MTATSSRAVAVYGALRSGTTLLRLMLDGHPKLACPDETDFLFDHLITDASGVHYDVAALEKDRIYRGHMADYADRPLGTFTPDAFIARIAGDDQTSVLMLHRHLDRVLDLYPDMRLIHMVRDPRDVARSSIGMGWAGTTYHGVDHWIDTETGWAAVADRLSPDQVLRISYEELIHDAETTLRKITDFCGLDYDPAMMRYTQGSTYARPDARLVDQWKRKQTPHEIALVEGKIGPLLDQAGYAPSGHAPIYPGALERLSLKIRNKASIWRERIRRFGLADPLIVAIISKIDLESMGNRAQRRMDDKLLRFLK